MVREIIVEWTTITGGGKRSVLYFDEATAVSDQRSEIHNWLTDLAGGLHTSTAWNVATSGRELDTATGTLTGIWSETTARNGAGSLATGQPVPDAAQILIQWTTGVVVNGRVIRGRTYIPGTSTANVANGNLAESVRASYATDSNTFVGATPSFVIWHRPRSGAGGVAVVVDAADCWREFGVQRNRRG